eukprot:TRINITY_DN62935_c0_g1_i1.p1 TRINITY_DN62935_c0_g1~~TRINITY_DN62935_c0_g1_i1.p1  ORF type:complete len:394 (+),score=67.58 TRINITY_DN62935_c0_g1_i1:112-1293(+)
MSSHPKRSRAYSGESFDVPIRRELIQSEKEIFAVLETLVLKEKEQQDNSDRPLWSILCQLCEMDVERIASLDSSLQKEQPWQPPKLPCFEPKGLLSRPSSSPSMTTPNRPMLSIARPASSLAFKAVKEEWRGQPVSRKSSKEDAGTDAGMRSQSQARSRDLPRESEETGSYIRPQPVYKLDLVSDSTSPHVRQDRATPPAVSDPSAQPKKEDDREKEEVVHPQLTQADFPSRFCLALLGLSERATYHIVKVFLAKVSDLAVEELLFKSVVMKVNELGAAFITFFEEWQVEPALDALSMFASSFPQAALASNGMWACCECQIVNNGLKPCVNCGILPGQASKKILRLERPQRCKNTSMQNESLRSVKGWQAEKAAHELAKFRKKSRGRNGSFDF